MQPFATMPPGKAFVKAAVSYRALRRTTDILPRPPGTVVGNRDPVLGQRDGHEGDIRAR